MGSREASIEAYQKVERDIIREEQAAPAPSLGHEMAKLDRFIADMENLMNQLSQERIADVELTSNDQFSKKYFNPRYGFIRESLSNPIKKCFPNYLGL
jgi:hypothetical protein